MRKQNKFLHLPLFIALSIVYLKLMEKLRLNLTMGMFRFARFEVAVLP
jgi:hypothetical protein